MDASAPLDTTLGQLGLIAAALLAAAAVLVERPRLRAAAMAGALVLTPILLIAEIYDTEQFRTLRDRPAFTAAAVAAALLAVVVLAFAMNRRPLLLPLLAVGALPFRIPVEAAGQTANLLVPLYGVIAAGALAQMPALFADREPQGTHERPKGPLALLLLAFVVLYALQAVYADDVSVAAQQVVFFYVPFALLFGLLVRLEWTLRLLTWCLGIVLALALAFALIGFVEYATRSLLLNPKVIASNAFASYFRVNSLFFDPNIYGRFLAEVMIAVAAVVAWTTRRRDIWLLAAALAVLWAALILTFSQSSFAALLAGLAVLAALRWGLRPVAIIVAVAIATGGGGRRRRASRSRRRAEPEGGEPRHRRALEARQRRTRALDRPAAARVRLGVVPGRVQAQAQPGQAERRHGVAHHADHGGRRAGPDRAGALRRAVGHRADDVARARAPGHCRAQRSARCSPRSSCTRWSTPRSWRTRPRGSCSRQAPRLLRVRAPRP